MDEKKRISKVTEEEITGEGNFLKGGGDVIQGGLRLRRLF